MRIWIDVVKVAGNLVLVMTVDLMLHRRCTNVVSRLRLPEMATRVGKFNFDVAPALSHSMNSSVLQWPSMILRSPI